MTTVKDYALRLVRTFASVFIASFPLQALYGGDVTAVKSAAWAAAAAGVNAVILAAQKLLPIPDP